MYWYKKMFILKTENYLVDYFNTLEMDDPILIEHIRKNLWLPGAPKDQPYKLEYPDAKDHSDGQLALFLDVFGVRFCKLDSLNIIFM